MVGLEVMDELVLIERMFQLVDNVSLLLKKRDGDGVDVLEQ